MMNNNGDVITCSFDLCNEEALARCFQCKTVYCIDHGSEVDPARYCVNCLIPQDAEILESPLVDRDGVTHKGRILTPIGKGYKLAGVMVSEMTDQELESYIEVETKNVHDIENIREYHKISLGIAQGEQYKREVGQLAKVGGMLRVGTSSQHFNAIRERRQKQAPTPKAKANKVDKTLQLLQSLGLTPEALASLIQDVSNQKSSKK